MRYALSLAICALGAALALAAPLLAQDAAGAPQSNAGAVAKNVGVVKSISGNTLVLKSDAGPEVAITVADGARLLFSGLRRDDLDGDRRRNHAQNIPLDAVVIRDDMQSRRRVPAVALPQRPRRLGPFDGRWRHLRV